MKRFNKLFLTALISAAFFASCSNDDNDNKGPRGDYDGGLFIVNEGNYLTPNGSISYLSDDLQIENNVFTLVNPGKVTGDTPLSISFNGDVAYIVVNGSNKIEVVNRFTFKSITTITTSIKNPRYIAFANGKGYITNWGDIAIKTDDYVAVLDLSSNAVTATIPVVEGPEKIIENNGKLYVAHKGGGGQGNSLTVINAANNTVTSNFVVGDVPSSLVKDNGTLYVLCNGRPSYAAPETTGKIVKVSLSTNTVTSTLSFPGVTHPDFLDIDNSKIYYTIGNSIYSMATNATALPSTETFKATEVSSLYGFAAKNGKLYVADAVNYQDNGTIYLYSLTGTVLNKYGVSILPNGFYFNN